MAKKTTIARAAERLIVAEAGLAWGRLKLSELFGDGLPATHAEDAWVLTAVMVGNIHGQPVTAHRLTEMIGMPRGSVRARLDRLVDQGLLRREGADYYVADHLLGAPRALDYIITVICDAADALRAVKEITGSVANHASEIVIN
jgi:hypothetical protein